MSKRVVKKEGGGFSFGPLLMIAMIVLLSINVFMMANRTAVPVPSPGPAPSPVVVDDARFDELRKVVQTADEAKVCQLGELSLAAADLLERSDRSWKVSELKSWLTAADTYFIAKTDIQGAVPGYGAAKDALLLKALGNTGEGVDDKVLEKQDMVVFIAELRAIAKVCGAEQE